METREIYPETVEIRDDPRNLQEIDRGFFKVEKSKKIPKSDLITARNIFVNDEGFAFNIFNTLDIGHPNSGNFNTFRYRISYLLKREKIHVKKNEETFILAFDSKYLGYFHWFADTIPRLISIKEQCKGAVLILPHNLLQFHLESLKIFQFKNIHYLKPLSFTKVPTLLLPQLIAPTGNFNKLNINKVREEYVSFYNLQSIKPYRKVYISRSKCKTRKIENENELMSLFEKHNIEFHCFEDYTFTEQMRLACESKIIISIHGAGLTNMLFMNSKTKILEIKMGKDKHKNLCYFSLASALNIDYYYLWGKPTDPTEDSHTANLYIDPLKLEGLVIEMQNAS